jgi:murein DD-endopeptidase MepM/ murein hydrolase activator NlpD
MDTSNLIRGLAALTLVATLAACDTPTYLLKGTATPTITATYTQEPTPTYTPTPVPGPDIEGELFFDMNSTGLKDPATFECNPGVLNNPKYPIQPDLDKVIQAYLAANPKTKLGDIITIDEPALTGYEVCAGTETETICGTTDAEGKFSIPNPANLKTAHLTIKDPYAGKKEWMMRYITEWIGELVIPTYTLKGEDLDPKYIGAPRSSPVYFQGNVAEQRLDQREIIEIADGIDAVVGETNPIGLMNGRIVSPFRAEDYPKLTKNGGFDHDPAGEKVRSFTGETTTCWDLYDCESKPAGSFSPFVGVKDGHSGIDWGGPNARGVPLYAVRNGIVFTRLMGDGPLIINLYPNVEFDVSNNSANDIGFGYGHLDSVVVPQLKEVVTGQLIGFIGSTGTNYEYPHLHLETDFGKEFPNFNLLGGATYAKDLYAMMNPRYIIKDFNDLSSWTVWNQPVFFPISYAK